MPSIVVDFEALEHKAAAAVESEGLPAAGYFYGSYMVLLWYFYGSAQVYTGVYTSHVYSHIHAVYNVEHA